MKKNNLLKTVLLLVFTILFLWSCRQESLYTDTKNNNNQKVHNKISLNTFKQETKVSKIEEFTVLKNSKSNGKDAGATSTFIIDSTSIYKLAVNNNLSTYSFRAYNIFESPNVLYNLVYHIKDGKTGYRIFKMEKDSAIPVYDSEIGAITIKKSSSKSISKTAGCTESIKIYIWDCKNGHDWEHCDHCKDCYDVSYYDVTYDCSGGLSGGSGTSTGTPPSNNAPQCGESNAGYSGVMLDPSGYYFDPNEPLSIDAEKLRASYAYNFWNQLDYSYQLWVYNGNIDTYQFILENYLNHYSTTNNTNNLKFANWGIDFFTQNPTTSLEQFQNWFSLNKSIDADLVSELKNLDSYKFTEYIQINKDLDSFDLYLQDPSYNPLDSPWLKKAREYAQKLEDWSKYLGPKAKAKAREMIDKSFIYALNKTAKELFENVENLNETQKQSYFQTDGKKGVAILLYEFANGLGKDRRDFSFDYNITQQFLQGKVTGDIRNDFLNNLSKNGLTYNQFIKNGNMIKGGYAFSPDHTTVEDSFSKHYNANWVQFFIGGANAEYYPTNENGWIRVVIWNQTTRNSLMLHQGDNYERDGSGNNLPLSTIKQYFTFKLQIF